MHFVVYNNFTFSTAFSSPVYKQNNFVITEYSSVH